MPSTADARPTDPAPARRAPATRAPAPSRTGGGRSHSHLWSLPDGTGLHAPHGELVVEPRTGKVCCHLCGRWFVSLAGHIRAHGHTADSYRRTMGLCRTRRLIAAELSRSIAARQARAYRDSPAVRSRLAAGQELSRTGRLTGLARAAQAGSGSPERTRIRRASLQAGRETRAARRREALTRQLRRLGAASIADHLRREYAAGTSLRELSRTTGLGWASLRRELDAAGVAVRTAGATNGYRQRERARTAGEAAARRVGTDDLGGWLRARRAEGWSLARLGDAVGHSAHWVRSRIPDDRIPDDLPRAHPGAGRRGRSGTADQPAGARTVRAT